MPSCGANSFDASQSSAPRKNPAYAMPKYVATRTRLRTAVTTADAAVISTTSASALSAVRYPPERHGAKRAANDITHVSAKNVRSTRGCIAGSDRNERNMA